MMKLSPATRIAIGLSLLTLSILLAADMFGVTPNTKNSIIDARQKVSENLAIQFALAAQKDDVDLIRHTLRATVERNDDILSAALRDKEGLIKFEQGYHTGNWPPELGKESTPKYIQVPIFRGDEYWGVVELRFSEINTKSFMGLNVDPIYPLLLFVTISGFFGFRLFMAKTLKQLDPTSLIPGRVKNALDSLTEGVVLMDGKGRVVLANRAFLKKTNKRIATVIGVELSKWDWFHPKYKKKYDDPPWKTSIEKNENITGKPMAIDLKEQGLCIFVVNSSLIHGDKNEVRGVLVTFNDVTEIERKNEELQATLSLLNESQSEVRRQNKHLKRLASEDSLTGCLNRRAFFEKAEAEFSLAKIGKTEFICAMIDIDLFKSVNDQFGHSTGDVVIKMVARLTREVMSKYGLVCRYGGEEFCIVLMGKTIIQAIVMLEELRGGIENEKIIERPITCSFGVSSLEFGAKKFDQIIDEADKSLYAAKESGRNKVISWSTLKAVEASPPSFSSLVRKRK